MKTPRKISTNISDYKDPSVITINELQARLFEIDAKLMQTQEKLEKYKKAYEIFCDDTWSFIPDDLKDKIHKKLKEINL
tara:strand:- start:2927 stop:3163 length:237 start_codon:yes stop_codon:yes gene_type:complete